MWTRHKQSSAEKGFATLSPTLLCFSLFTTNIYIHSQAFLHWFQSDPDALEIWSLVHVFIPAVFDTRLDVFTTSQLSQVRSVQVFTGLRAHYTLNNFWKEIRFVITKISKSTETMIQGKIYSWFNDKFFLNTKYDFSIISENKTYLI